ncbi:hypothetical protein [Brevundimonas sp.]
MKPAAVVLACTVTLATPAFAQSPMTLETFVTQANRIPLNPLSAVRTDARRLIGVSNRAFSTINREDRADRAAGRRTTSCPPGEISVNPRQLLAFLNAIPQARRTRMSVEDGFREWLASRYPCPAA